MPRCVRTAHVFEKKWRSDDVRLQEEASFSSLLLPDKILLGLENAGYKTPSPIQLESIPVGRFGRDLLVQAKSGTGKTLVFTVIALESISEIKYPQVLIMAPTREIALQICDVVRAVGSAFKGLTCNCFIGGVAVDTDIERVHGCQIIVGTPGRLKHLISLGILPTNSIRLLVLDEADVLLESNFKDDLDYIFVSLPKEKQVIATSATYPRELRTLTRQYFRKVYLARLNRNELTLLGMVHYIQVLELPKMSLLAYKAKLAALENVVTSVHFTQCLVFCNLISRVESLCYDIRNWGFTSTFISSAKEQCDRIRAIECLKRFKCKILVTSDVTSRGIDAENVDLVVNFDKPFNTEVYFHRCGRAGRYGAKGVAITFLEKDEVLVFEQMKVKHNLKAYNLPDPIPTNLINIRPTDSDSSTEKSEEDDSSDEISKKDSDDLNDNSNNNSDSKVTKENICTNSSTLYNGKTSSNLNGHMVEKYDANEPTSFNKDNNSKLSTPGEFKTENEKSDCTVNNELNISSALDIIKQNLISEVVTMNGDNHIVSEIRVTSELVKDKNSFLEYLESGPKNIESSSTTGLVSEVSSVSTDNMVSQELESNTIILEVNNTAFQNNIQPSSEKQCLNNVSNTLEADNTKEGVTEDEMKENFEKLIFSSDDVSNKDSNDHSGDSNNGKVTKEDISEDSSTLCNLKVSSNIDGQMVEKNVANETTSFDKDSTLEPLTQEENMVSVNNSVPTLPNSSETDQVSKEASNETKTVFIPNKIQLSVGKFLMDNCDVNNLNSAELNISSTDKDRSANETEQDITKTFKDIRGDLTVFYSKVYKAYQTENLTDAAFQNIKDLVMQQREEEKKKSAKENIKHISTEASSHQIRDSDEKITKTVCTELNKVNGQNSADLKSSDINMCDGSSNSLVANESILSQENDASGAGQVFEKYVFKPSSADDSLSSSDSKDNSYLTLKGSFDSMKTSEKTKSKTNLHASQKSEKEKCVIMKKKKFSLNADKRQHSSPLNTRKLSEYSNVSSSDEDDENHLEEVYGAKVKVSNGKQNFKPDKSHQADNKLRSKNKAKPCKVVRIDKSNRTSTTESESSESMHSSQYAHNTSTSYLKKSKSANSDHRHRTGTTNYGNLPFPSHQFGHATSTVNYGNISSVSQPYEHIPSAMNYGNIASTSRPHDHTISAVNHGNITSTSRPHDHAISAVKHGNITSASQCHEHSMNCGNFSTMNHHQECQLPSYPYCHQINGYAAHNYRPNQVNMSCTGRGSHNQLRNVCHNCNANWYQMYMKQWQFIHSSLF